MIPIQIYFGVYQNSSLRSTRVRNVVWLFHVCVSDPKQNYIMVMLQGGIAIHYNLQILLLGGNLYWLFIRLHTKVSLT